MAQIYLFILLKCSPCHNRADSNGNITGANKPAKTFTMTYNPVSGRTRRIDMTSPTETSYVGFQYAASDERVMKKADIGGTVTWKIYLHGTSEFPLMTLDSGGNVDYYVYGITGMVAKKTATETFFIVKDRLGSTRVVMNTNNAPVSGFDYDAFGQPTEFVVNEEMHYLYTGQEYDSETGLWNFRARMYDSDLMRFYSVDPMEQGNSPYLFCGNNPVMFVDRDGNFFWLALAIGAASGALMGALSAEDDELWYQEALKGAITGVCGAALGALGDPTSVLASVGVGVLEGGVTGALNDVLDDGQFNDWTSTAIGAGMGGVFGFARTEQFRNWVRRDGFQTNEELWKEMVERKDYEGLQKRFFPNAILSPESDVHIWGANPMGLQATDPNTGQIYIRLSRITPDSYGQMQWAYWEEEFHKLRVETGADTGNRDAEDIVVRRHLVSRQGLLEYKEWVYYKAPFDQTIKASACEMFNLRIDSIVNKDIVARALGSMRSDVIDSAFIQRYKIATFYERAWFYACRIRRCY